MGIRFTVAGKTVRPESYRVQESSMPLAGGDSSGAVGTIEIDVPTLPNSPLGLNLEEPIEVIDTARGSTLGTVRAIDGSRTAGARYNVRGSNRLGEFNIEAQVLPFTGTLEAAFRYYCSIANIDTGIVVSPALASRQVAFPGWTGNLWTHLKMMATAIGADLNLISNNVVLRPVRLFEAIRDREIEASPAASSEQLALKQEVIWYDTKYVANGLIYPASGWSADITPLSVNAGEEVETVLDDTKDVHSSIFSVNQPVMVTSQGFNPAGTDSVYTVVGDDGVEIQPAQWRAYGGSLSVRVSEDSRSLIVTMRGASGLVQLNGEPMRTFRIGLASGTGSNNTYSTLRITGRHISVKENSLILPTGVAPYRTGQEFAPTIDNPFLTTLSAAYSAGVRGARRYAGRTVSIAATVSAINRRNNTGTANYPPYSYAQALWSGKTYAQVKTANAGKSYTAVRAEFYAAVQDDFDNQVFGNAPGARYYDRETARWYRVRQATTEWGQMSIDGDDDLTIGDMQAKFQGMTYGAVKAHYGGMSYYKANLRGMA